MYVCVDFVSLGIQDGTFVCSELGEGMMGCLVKCWFWVMYVVSNFVVVCAVEVFLDYGGVHVFHVLIDLCCGMLFVS